MTGRSALAWLGGAVLLVAATFFLNDYTADLFRKMLLTVTLALSFNFLFGIAGQLAFSHVAFYGIGAYAIVILAYQFELAASARIRRRVRDRVPPRPLGGGAVAAARREPFSASHRWPLHRSSRSSWFRAAK